MTDLLTVQARVAALAQAMLGAIGPISPPNDVKGARVQLWIEKLTDISKALSVEQGRQQVGQASDVPSLDYVGAIHDLKLELARVRAERDAALAAEPSRRAGTEPAIALHEHGPQERWTPTPPTRKRVPLPRTDKKFDGYRESPDD